MRFLRSNRHNNYNTMYINRTLGSLLLTLGLMAEVYTPYTVPNPRTTDGKAFVADPDHLLSAEERNAIQDAAEQLYTLTGVEMVTVLLDDIGYADAFDFAYDLFNEWGIGDSEMNTGVLLFFTMQQHDIRITTGKGLEGLLPDAVCYDIIVDDIIPLLRAGVATRLSPQRAQRATLERTEPLCALRRYDGRLGVLGGTPMPPMQEERCADEGRSDRLCHLYLFGTGYPSSYLPLLRTPMG